jgi:hypothetical protein
MGNVFKTLVFFTKVILLEFNNEFVWLPLQPWSD